MIIFYIILTSFEDALYYIEFWGNSANIQFKSWLILFNKKKLIFSWKRPNLILIEYVLN